MNRLWNTLTEAELSLIRETERDAMAGMDEDDLVAVHTRIRRARDKYVKLYRREAGARVEEFGGRGTARPKNQRNAEKAEVFEDALARVSRQLAAVARRTATDLRTERLATARRARTTAPPRAAAAKPRPARKSSQVSDRRPDSPARRKQQASTKAAGARRQARRDSR